jgi:DNA-binding NtrC family response regulator
MSRILYLDDDLQLAGLLAERLERAGHSMVVCGEASRALQVFNDNPRQFDLVLTDMSMPGGNGLEFAQAVLKIDPEARVIIASGCEDPNWADFARSVGVEAVLLKPFQAKELADILIRLLK